MGHSIMISFSSCTLLSFLLYRCQMMVLWNTSKFHLHVPELHISAQVLWPGFALQVSLSVFAPC